MNVFPGYIHKGVISPDEEGDISTVWRTMLTSGIYILKGIEEGTSLVVHWLRLRAPNAGGLGSIPGQGTRSHMLQLRMSAVN